MNDNRERVDQIYRVANEYTLNHFQGEQDRYYLFNIRNGKIFRLNAVSYAMLEAFDGEKPLSEIAALLSRRFTAEPEVIENDLKAMVAVWSSQGILIPKGES